MPECGGLRKLRWLDVRRGKGKRGGCRVLYLHHPTANRIDLLTVYDKGEQDNPSTEQKRQLRMWVEQAKAEAKLRHTRP